MKNKKFIILISIIGLLLVTGLTVFSVDYVMSKAARKEFSNEIIDRINIEVSPTQQTFEYSDGGTYVFSATLSAKKTEADFYAVLHSLSLSGMNYQRLVVTPCADLGTTVGISDTLLTAADGECDTYTWQIDIYFTADSKNAKLANLELDYTSGVKQAAASKHKAEIPIEIYFED